MHVRLCESCHLCGVALNLEIAAWALQLLPMMLIGLTAGIWTVKKVSPDWIRRAVILALIVSGAALIINNI